MMKKLALAVAFLSLAVVCPVYAGPIASPPCCACFVPDTGEPVVALFCVSPTSTDEEVAAEERCTEASSQSMAQFYCVGFNALQTGETVSQDATPSCVAELRAENIICPQAAAPALDSKALAALAGLLALLGAWALRRRVRRSGPLAEVR